MKTRITALTVLLAVLAFGFSGCGRLLTENNPPPVAFPDAYIAEISYGEFSGVAEISYESYECYTLTFTQPLSVAGFTVRLENSVYRYEMLGIATESKGADMPPGAAPAMIFDALRALMTKSYTLAEYSDGGWDYEGAAAGKMFLARQDAEIGRLVSLSVPGAGLEVRLAEAEG